MWLYFDALPQLSFRKEQLAKLHIEDEEPVGPLWVLAQVSTMKPRYRRTARSSLASAGMWDWSVISLGGLDWSTASNIIFSNGEYDPWKIGRLPRAPAHVKFSNSPIMHNIYTQ